MKNLLTVALVFVFMQLSLNAQLGINAGYISYDAKEYSSIIQGRENLDASSTDFKQNSVQFGLDYWFRLPNKRIEFLPELSYFGAKAEVSSTTGIDAARSSLMQLNAFQLNFNTHIYPFDFAGDCDCPTFSKDGDILKKGFFIRLAPGLSVNQFNEEQAIVTISGSENSTSENIGVGLNLRAGIGLDIGVSDFFTITPIAQYTYTFPTGPFHYFIDPSLQVGDDLSTMSQLYLGIRLGFRFDELNKYGYR